MRKEFAIAIAVGLIIVVVWAAAFFAFALFHPRYVALPTFERAYGLL